MGNRLPLRVSEEVADALRDGAPVVALESNVITHGLPYPENAATARKVADAVRAGGAVPATIAIDRAHLLVGLDEATVERFATVPGIAKVSSRDLAAALATGGPGATTVASSLVAAELAGIAFFSSAGVGGVHRGAQRTMDISPDLVQFTRSKVAVVSAGAKSILDLRLTCEFLETHCVPVISYRSDDFPAFYCVSSGVRGPRRLDDPDTVARTVELHWALGNPGAVLITTPIRAEDALDPDEVDRIITEATARAERDGVRGDAVTRYLMRAVDTATGGRAAAANAAVLVSTAEVAGQLASAHAALANRGGRR
ncbi:pseudouridine-5'-phosphate glycosidase [Pseudonocardia acaciae]|uniref:pseudouridine-5'-phosphate glycosidase n=1 Tax=Pseudonocardia acaciae TaxID=551276 RepID=UPI00048BEAEB|nr:pseudouridine-5'-phosphate glycosidase [Pseudonocardia acaciae]